MPKTLGQMRKRLEEAMSQADDAEEIIPLVKKVIAQYELLPGDLFDLPDQAPQVWAAYQDGNGNTWAGRGRRPTWLNEALEQGHTLADFKVPIKRLSRAK